MKPRSESSLKYPTERNALPEVYTLYRHHALYTSVCYLPYYIIITRGIMCFLVFSRCSIVSDLSLLLSNIRYVGNHVFSHCNNSLSRRS